jgi:hypothetical protein
MRSGLLDCPIKHDLTGSKNLFGREAAEVLAMIDALLDSLTGGGGSGGSGPGGGGLQTLESHACRRLTFRIVNLFCTDVG